jgi:ATP-binding cassette subfamily B protein
MDGVAPFLSSSLQLLAMLYVTARIDWQLALIAIIDFGYRENQPVLRDIQVEIRAGIRVGIVGHTRAGKSSLVSLLMRFYDPTRGAILLDDVDLREFRVSDLRRQFAVVLQEPVLFAASIGENIAYARPGASEAEIESAARAANAHAFIQSLPDGYQTQVGERGLQLSGGERQRISLARAFLRDAPILILDEPTSAVDVHTEAVIMDAMQRLMQGRTTFIIAHRLVTLKNCGIILHLDAGRLTQVLKPDDVARQGAGLFAASSPSDPLVQERSNA